MAAVIASEDAIHAGGRAIVGAGTPESVWRAWPALAGLRTCTLDDLLPQGARLVVVAPHPDDEVLACGGLLALAAQRATPTRVVSVTDGDASHPGSSVWVPARLAEQRHEESLEGLRRLGCRSVSIRCRLPDGAVAAHIDGLVRQLRAELRTGDTVVTTWRADGHPDHEATAVAVRIACEAVACRLLQVPVWMWHWARPGDPRVPWAQLRQLRLSVDARRRKAAAIDAHRTQLAEQDSGAPPVLPPGALQRLLRPAEYFLFPGED